MSNYFVSEIEGLQVKLGVNLYNTSIALIIKEIYFE